MLHYSILVLGDSHTRCFLSENTQNSIFKYEVKCVTGASAQGAVNPNSTTNALQEFQNILSTDTSIYDAVTIQLGEVDCGFVIWYRSQKYKISIQEQVNLSLANYEKFLKEIVEPKFKNVLVLSVPMPFIEDTSNNNFLSGSRKGITASLKDRTELTLNYNKKLYNICQKNKYHFIDVTNDTVDDRFKVKQEYLNKNKWDHHMNPKVIWKVYEKRIKECLDLI